MTQTFKIGYNFIILITVLYQTSQTSGLLLIQILKNYDEVLRSEGENGFPEARVRRDVGRKKGVEEEHKKQGETVDKSDEKQKNREHSECKSI